MNVSIWRASSATCAANAEYAAEGLRKARASGDRAAEASPLHLYAAGARLSGDYDRARELYLESVDAAERMFAERDARSGLDAMGDAWTELNHAAVALARGHRDEAIERFEVGSRQIVALGASLDPDDQFEYDWLRDQLAP